VVYLSLF